MTVDASSASITVVDRTRPTATPNLGAGNYCVANLTNGFNSDPSLVQWAFEFYGGVKVSGASGTTLPTLRVGFVQFIQHLTMIINYAGRRRSEGSLTIFPAVGTGYMVDASSTATLPFVLPWNNDFDSGEVGAKMGDHPVLSVAQIQRNFSTGVDNYLFQVTDRRTAVSLFVVYDVPTGKYQALAHLYWDLRYDLQFGWTAGSVRISRNSSTFVTYAAQLGAPSDPAFRPLLSSLGPSMSPLANDQVRAALRAALVVGNPRRFETGEQYDTVPTDFYL